MIMKVSEKIVALRKSKNLSQIQLAEKLGVSRQAISKWESGGTLPGIDSIIEISNFFNITIDSLLKENIEELHPIEELQPIMEEEEKESIRTVQIKVVILLCIASFFMGVLITWLFS